MAATLMQQPAHRPSMDHVASFDRSRPSSTVSAPFGSPNYERSPSPATQGSAGAPGAPRSRTSSNNSAAPTAAVTAAQMAQPVPSPYTQQQYANYFAANPGYAAAMHQQAAAWGAPNGVPAPSFYAAPFHAYPNGPAPGAYQQGFQHGQADFSAWAHVYQQMVAGGHMPAPGSMPPMPAQQQQEHDDVADPPRRRTVSSASAAQPSSQKAIQQPQQPFHPYQRGPKHRSNGSRDTVRSASLGSVSVDGLGNKVPRSASQELDHIRTASADMNSPPPLSANDADLVPPPKLGARDRPASVKSQGSSRDGSRSPVSTTQSRTASPTVASPPASSTPSIKSASRSSTPLTTGTIATNATNSAQSRPSPLSQTAPAAEQQQLSDKKQARHQQQQQQQQQPRQVSRSRPAPPANGHVDLAPPNAPFINVQAMASDVSLAETQRTAATTTPSIAGAKSNSGKRSLFRMKNKSSDNMSISSTVSSASMMIRKLGSLGKLARRNSLMGISKIFKDKPKDEDAPVPAKQGVLSFKKKNGKKAEVAPAEVSHATAELDRISEDEDRVLSGLTPAAKLARQHTVRSRQEAAKKAEESKRAAMAQVQAIPELAGPSGEPTWDVSTTTRATQIAEASAAAAVTAPSVVHVVPRSSGPTIVQAVAYTFDSDAESSDGDDTVDDITTSMHQTSLVDDDFRPLWVGPNINHKAQPKKGILKNTVSNENMETASRQRSSSTSETVLQSSAPGRSVLSPLTAPTPERIDGVAHAPHVDSIGGDKVETVTEDPGTYDPLSPDFSPFDSGPIELDLKPSIYKRPVLNTSAPSLSLAGHGVQPQAARAMTAPIRRRLIWAPECAVYSTYDAGTYDRRSEPATCNRLTPELAMAIKQELNAFKLEMPVHPDSRVHTHYFA